VAPMLSHHKSGGACKVRPSSRKRDCIHLILVAVLARALYSASVLDQATVTCLRQLQEIRFFPRKTQKLPVERLSSLLPAQSTSEKA
jgi:hypothetical protein